MKKNKTQSETTLVLYGICAVIWTLIVLLSIAHRAYEYVPGLFVLNILAALVWITAFIKWLIVYRRAKENAQDKSESK